MPKPSRRLLVITYHFPPDGAVGGLRWAGFSKYLGRLGWEVHIVTAAAPGADAPVENVHRHTQARGRTLNDAYLSMARRVRGRASANGNPSATRASAAPWSTTTSSTATSHAAPSAQRPSLIAKTIFEARLAGRIAMGFPDVGRGWLSRAARLARALQEQQPFDAVVTSGPPHSAHMVGLMATLGRDVPVFVELRDPWFQSQESWGAPGVTSGWVQSMYSVVRRSLFRRATSVIVNTPELSESLRRAEPELVVASVSNGIDLELLPPRTAERLDGFSIAYVGTVYMSRNFSIVIDGMRSLRRDRPDVGAKVTLHVAGQMDPEYLERLRADLAADGLTNNVHFYGPTPRTQALELLARSNLALVLAQNQPTQIPAKIYECVGLGVPTLVVAESNSAAAREAQRIGAMTFESSDVVGMRWLLDDMVDGRLPPTMPPTVPISYEALAVQMDRVLRRGA